MTHPWRIQNPELKPRSSAHILQARGGKGRQLERRSSFSYMGTLRTPLGARACELPRARARWQRVHVRAAPLCPRLSFPYRSQIRAARPQDVYVPMPGPLVNGERDLGLLQARLPSSEMPGFVHPVGTSSFKELSPSVPRLPIPVTFLLPHPAFWHLGAAL